MARRRGRKRKGGKSKSIPLAVVMPVALKGVSVYNRYGTWQERGDHAIAEVTGFQPSSGRFDATWAMPFWGGMIAGIVVHKVANKTGVNRHIRKLTMGYLSL